MPEWVKNMPEYRFDGAFGTLYQSRGGREEICEAADLREPTLVAGIHRDYISAGADAIKTNTYQANPLVFPDNGMLSEVISAGFRIANMCAAEADVRYGKKVEVFADIGGIPADYDTASDGYMRVAGEFLRLGADRFLFETLDDLAPLIPALVHVKKERPDSVVIVSFATAQDGYTRLGRNIFTLLGAAAEYADFVGMNCVCGPSVMLGLASEIPSRIPGFDMRRLSLMPNASYPARQNGRMVFADNTVYFAEKLASMAALGVGAVGGCCGTTPEHMRLAYLRLGESAEVGVYGSSPEQTVGRKSFFECFDYSGKLIAIELNPPVNTDSSFFCDCAHRFIAAGVDALTLTDSPLARGRADPMALAAKLHRETGMPVLPHLTCRDRNRIAMKGAMLAAAMDGVDSVLAITGDSPDEGLRSDGIKAVYNMSSLGLISYISSLNEDVFAASPMYVAGALNVNAPNFGAELSRAEKKIAAGAKMLMTQAIFTPESAENLKRAYKLIKEKYPDVRLLAGIMPLAGYKNAVFLKNEVGGIAIPDGLIEKLKDASKEDAKRIVIDFAERTIDEVYAFADGFYIMFPLKRYELAEELVGYIRGKR